MFIAHRRASVYERVSGTEKWKSFFSVLAYMYLIYVYEKWNVGYTIYALILMCVSETYRVVINLDNTNLLEAYV